MFGDGSGAAALTPEAPQNQNLSRLGFDLTEVPEEVKGDLSMGADRGDIISLSIENIQAGLPGENWISFSSDKENQEMIKNEPAFNTSPAVTEGRVYHTPASTFRLDYFSANILVDSIVEQFSKSCVAAFLVEVLSKSCAILVVAQGFSGFLGSCLWT